MQKVARRRALSPALKDEQKVVAIVQDAGGELVGRTRLQKVSYLLELAGLGSGFSFEYRHYGPYSEELASAVRKACLLGLLEEEERQTNWEGTYSIYRSKSERMKSSGSAREKLIKEAAKADPIELELAATAAFLSTQGMSDPWEETARRKPEKADGNRLDNARELYKSLATITTPRPLPEIV